MKRSSQGMEDQTASLKWISVSQNRSKVELTGKQKYAAIIIILIIICAIFLFCYII